MKSPYHPLTASDFAICEVLQATKRTPLATSKLVGMSEPEAITRMAKLEKRGILALQGDGYILPKELRLATNARREVLRDHGDRWAVRRKTEAEKASKAAERKARYKLEADIRNARKREKYHSDKREKLELKHAQLKERFAKVEPLTAKAYKLRKDMGTVRGQISVEKVRAKKYAWFGLEPRLELQRELPRHPACFDSYAAYRDYLVELQASGAKATQGICTDCDRATMERMGADV